MRIRLVDEASGGWGHVNFDDFRPRGTDIRARHAADPGGADDGPDPDGGRARR
jgi:hypothetical protein